MRLRDTLSFRFMRVIITGLIIVLVLGFLWELQEQRKQALLELREKSAVIAEELLATRAFIAASQDRINTDSKGNFEFKHMNPARVVQEISRIFNEVTRYRIKQTRLNPRIPENSPDEYERRQLERFAGDPTLNEVWGEDRINGERVFRYMIPLYMKRDCLQCHGEPKGELDIAGHRKEGYQLGELAGAISIIAPMDAFEASVQANILNRAVLVTTLVVLAAVSIYLLMHRLVTRPLAQLGAMATRFGEGHLSFSTGDISAHGEIRHLADQFYTMAGKLKDLYNNLEDKVAERTELLSKAYRQLQTQQEELRRANQELSEANKYKSQFLANMSHELRTPLTSVLAFAEMLLNRVAGEITPEQEEYLRDIHESGTHLLQLINGILDFSKVEAGKMEMRWEEFQLLEVVETVSRMVRPIAAKKDLAFEVEVPSNLPAIRGDREKIKQVIGNLLSNAIKFTPPGGRVTLKADTIDEPALAVKVAVADTGIGIKPEDRENIFQEFRQVDQSASREYPGTGLGLALARQLVEMHGGNIWVESEPGKGSCFTFVLPVDGC
ncbi:hypothetical protein SY88_18225 [Clostridiales bacterium PH28_bin88]|nr:hypothetical protein SY88_18225 [Clostridiales bacterium PH28_bin88]